MLDHCGEIIHNHFDCPICKTKNASIDVYMDMSDNNSYTFCCEECDTRFKALDKNPNWYDEVNIQVINLDSITKELKVFQKDIKDIKDKQFDLIVNSDINIKEQTELLFDFDVLKINKWVIDELNYLPFYEEWLGGEYNSKYEVCYLRDYVYNFLLDQIFNHYDDMEAFIHENEITFEEVETIIYKYIVDNKINGFIFDW